ncbi:MAG: hypothetical protein ACJAVK_000964 [Akkermansiaceae bacterium]|jgi:hypothetical protein
MSHIFGKHDACLRKVPRELLEISFIFAASVFSQESGLAVSDVKPEIPPKESDQPLAPCFLRK